MTKRIKILYFIQLPPPVHGVSTINDFIYHNAFINENIDKHLVEIKFSNKLTELRRTTFRKIIHFFRILRQLKHAIRQTRPDYVYFSIMPVGKGFWRDLLFVRLIRKHRVKTIYHLHNKGIERRIGSRIFRKLYRYTFQDSIIIHLTEALMRGEIGKLNLNNSLKRIIPNGIPVLNYEPVERQDPIKRILFVSNLFPAKGMFDLLHIMKILKETGTEVQLYIVGEFMRRKYRRRFYRMRDKFRLNESVHLMGPRFGTEKWKAYQDADIFLFPTRFKQESFPLVVLEAMQFGLPVITSRIGAIPEIIDHGRNGFVFDQSDHAAFARTVMELLRHKDKLREIGMAARQTFHDNYTAAHLEKNIRDLYDDCLADIR